jgi:hypothetical protein
LAVCFAFALTKNGVGKVFGYCAPCDIPARPFVKTTNVVAGLNYGAAQKPGFQVFLSGCHLSFELLETSAKRQQQHELGLGDLILLRCDN